MIDDELTTALREQRGTVTMTTPVEQIIGRGRAVRALRRVPGIAAAVGAAAVVAFAVGVALPASHPAVGHPSASHPAASHPASGPGVQLTAWTVIRQADGSIKVTFREATDPAGLQRTLRADGVPVSVTFTGQQNPACQRYSSSGQAFWPYSPKTDPLVRPTGKDAFTTPYALVINPSALPSGVGLEIWTSGTPGGADNFQLQVLLVRTSPQCTGS
jgi:hypothetical protein